MTAFSVCMIVKNEEEVLERCLQCITSFADEIIIVDTGSTDKTKEIASKYTHHIYDFPWCNDFSKARNFSFSKASKDFIMWLDADDIILKEDQQKLCELKKRISDTVSMVMMKYHTAFDKEGNPTFTFYRERLLNRKMNHQWNGAVHEAITPAGIIVYEDISIMHKKTKVSDPNRNLAIYEALIQQKKSLDPREQHYYGRELYDHGEYHKAIRIFEAYLKEGKGWKENQIEACLLAGNCFMALEKREKGIIAYLKSFIYDEPRAEICCAIGDYFIHQSRWEEATFWYNLALQTPMKEERGGFIRKECYGYLPAIQLCVCYYWLHDIEKAIQYNEKAAVYNPSSEAVLYNRVFFGNLSD